jgi:hypothetical protein
MNPKLAMLTLLTITLSTMVYSKPKKSSFQSFVEQYKDVIEIAPVQYQGMPVSAQPIAICKLAGYKLAVSSEEESISERQLYVEVTESRGDKGSYFELEKRTLGKFGKKRSKKMGETFKVLKKVVCRR